MADRKIIFGNAENEMGKILNNSKNIFITDRKVYGLYKDSLFRNKITIVIPSGEKAKSLKTAEKLYTKLIELEADRKTVIIGAGGGVVCDITGFVADTFKRGTGLILVPTTLLAQVDAAIGGKNGVNFKGFKNIIGSFREPDQVIIDSDFLKSLDRRNFYNGTAEIIKTSLIYGGELYEKIRLTDLLKCDKTELDKIIRRTAEVKAEIVKNDVYDKGIRRILNFGHTIGHAIELSSKNLLHGEAVSMGIVTACRISEKLTDFPKTGTKEIIKLLKMNLLPAEILDDITPEQLISSIVQDKKRESENIEFILLNNIGEPVIKKIKISDLKELLNDIC